MSMPRSRRSRSRRGAASWASFPRDACRRRVNRAHYLSDWAAQRHTPARRRSRRSMTDQTLETRDKNATTMNRRETLKSALATGLAVAAGGKRAPPPAREMVTLPLGNGERPLVAYPGKRPLIVLTSRPPQLETPFSVFDEGVFTPNDAFFVRYHLADIPLKIDPDAFRLTVQGKVDTPLSLSLAELRNGFEPIELAAVNQCSGNSRGFFEPRVAGGQLANGAMGNARWKGVPLKALLTKAGVQAGAVPGSF